MVIQVLVVGVLWAVVTAALVSWVMGRRARGSWLRSEQVAERDRMPDTIAGSYDAGRLPPEPPPFY